MEFCPECGKKVKWMKEAPDIPTVHTEYRCQGGHRWTETISNDGDFVQIIKDEVSEENSD